MCVCVCGWIGVGAILTKAHLLFIRKSQRRGAGAASVTDVFSLLTVRWVLSKSSAQIMLLLLLYI